MRYSQEHDAGDLFAGKAIRENIRLNMSLVQVVISRIIIAIQGKKNISSKFNLQAPPKTG